MNTTTTTTNNNNNDNCNTYINIIPSGTYREVRAWARPGPTRSREPRKPTTKGGERGRKVGARRRGA